MMAKFCTIWTTISILVQTIQTGIAQGTVPKVKNGQPATLSVARLTQKNDGIITDEARQLAGRVLKFTKNFDASLVKVTYADNFRVFGNREWCRWTIKIDGKDCAIPVYNSKCTEEISDDDRAPHAIAGTCAGISTGDHTMTIALTRSSSNANCITGWSASASDRDAFFMEAEELNPAGQITSAMRKGSIDPRDDGYVVGRTLNFHKRSDSSQLRITWATNLRVKAYDNQGEGRCDWEIQIDGKSCPKPSSIGVSMHSQGNDNDQIPVELVGWCHDIKSGPHIITVHTTRGEHNNADCLTGWGTNDYMEVWEPTPQEQVMVTYQQRVGTDDSSSSSSKPVATTTFNKQSSSSGLRILYFDNLRVFARGEDAWCRWEVKVDGKSCKVPLAGSVHTKSGDNDFYPRTILGECSDVGAGEHRINIMLTRSDQADCFTGFTPGPRVMHALIEVQETSAPRVQSCPVSNSKGLRGAVRKCKDVVCGGASQCVDNDNGFECFCAKGWIGGGVNACCEDVNECAGVQCGGSESKCVDGIDMFECLCAEGYSDGGVNAICRANVCRCAFGVAGAGPSCPQMGAERCVSCDHGYDLQMDNTCKNTCARINCGAHGDCYSGKCYCKDKYTGSACDVSPDPCATVNCGDHGKCFDGNCFCKDFYSGKYCETPPSGSGSVVVVHGRD